MMGQKHKRKEKVVSERASESVRRRRELERNLTTCRQCNSTHNDFYRRDLPWLD